MVPAPRRNHCWSVLLCNSWFATDTASICSTSLVCSSRSCLFSSSMAITLAASWVRLESSSVRVSFLVCNVSFESDNSICFVSMSCWMSNFFGNWPPNLTTGLRFASAGLAQWVRPPDIATGSSPRGRRFPSSLACIHCHRLFVYARVLCHCVFPGEECGARPIGRRGGEHK